MRRELVRAEAFVDSDHSLGPTDFTLYSDEALNELIAHGVVKQVDDDFGGWSLQLSLSRTKVRAIFVVPMPILDLRCAHRERPDAGLEKLELVQKLNYLGLTASYEAPQVLWPGDRVYRAQGLRASRYYFEALLMIDRMFEKPGGLQFVHQASRRITTKR